MSLMSPFLSMQSHIDKQLSPVGWVFESQPRQSQVVKTGSDSSAVKRSVIAVGFMGPRK